MVQNCCVVNCSNRASKDSTFTFHSFPCRDADRLAVWIARISRKNPDGSDWYPKPRDKVCSAHFVELDYLKGHSRAELKSDAVPSVFPNYPKHKQVNLTRRKSLKKRRLCEPSTSLEPQSKKMKPSASLPEDHGFVIRMARKGRQARWHQLQIARAKQRLEGSKGGESRSGTSGVRRTIQGETSGNNINKINKSEDVQDIGDSEITDLDMEVTEEETVEEEDKGDDTDVNIDSADDAEQGSDGWQAVTVSSQASYDHGVAESTTININDSSSALGGFENQILVKTEVEQDEGVEKDDVDNVLTITEMQEQLHSVLKSEENATAVVKEEPMEEMAVDLNQYKRTVSVLEWDPNGTPMCAEEGAVTESVASNAVFSSQGKASQQLHEKRQVKGVSRNPVRKVRAKKALNAPNACLVCSAPCHVTNIRKIPNLPFCQKCKKAYYYQLSALRKERKRICPCQGRCRIDFRLHRICPECHFQKFQNMLKAEILALRSSGNVENSESIVTPEEGGLGGGKDEFAKLWSSVFDGGQAMGAVRRQSASQDSGEGAVTRSQHPMTRRKKKPVNYRDDGWMRVEFGSNSDTNIAVEARVDIDQDLYGTSNESQESVEDYKSLPVVDSVGASIDDPSSACSEQTMLNGPRIEYPTSGDNERPAVMAYTDNGNHQNADFNNVQVLVFTCDHVCSKCNSSGSIQEDVKVNHTVIPSMKSQMQPWDSNNAASEELLRAAVLTKLNEIAQMMRVNTSCSLEAQKNASHGTVPVALIGTNPASLSTVNSIDLTAQPARTQSVSHPMVPRSASRPGQISIPTFLVSLEDKTSANTVQQPTTIISPASTSGKEMDSPILRSVLKAERHQGARPTPENSAPGLISGVQNVYAIGLSPDGKLLLSPNVSQPPSADPGCVPTVPQPSTPVPKYCVWKGANQQNNK